MIENKNKIIPNQQYHKKNKKGLKSIALYLFKYNRLRILQLKKYNQKNKITPPIQTINSINVILS